MKLDLFSIPFWINNIEIEKIKLNNIKFEKTWNSNTLSSHNFPNKLEPESEEYLLSKIAETLDKKIKRPYKIILISIWENKYDNGDFQEKHEHAGSHLSFVIYKKITNSNTVFINPNITLLESYYDESVIYDLFDKEFKPSCRQGQIVIFPSFLSHMVLKNNNSATIAGNLKIEKINQS